MEDEIIRVSCIRHIYSDETKVDLCGLDFIVREKERIAIIGPSGSGKTTLLKHILGLLKPSEGMVKVFGLDPIENFLAIREKIGFVMQNVDEQLVQPKVYDEISFAPLNYGYPKDEVKQLADTALKRLGIMHLKDRVPHYLSGGEKRKVALASAIVLNPKLLVLDEPFQGLDQKSINDTIKLLNALVSDLGVTLVTTLHDVDIIPSIADHVYLLKFGGAISRKGTPKEIFENIKELRDYNLEPPILSKLFNKLKEELPDIKIPLNIDDALTETKKILSEKNLNRDKTP